MTEGQKESLNLIYTSVCNGLLYSQDLYNDETFSKSGRDAVRPIMHKFEWMKKAIDAKVGSYNLRSIDTLRFDEILRLMSTLPEDGQSGLEKLIADYVDKYAMDKMSELQESIHTDNNEKETKQTDLSDL